MNIYENVARWTVSVHLSELDGQTHAEARLMTGADSHLYATGVARLSPHDRYDVPEVGYELAAGRALEALGHKLLATAEDDVEGIDPLQKSH